MVSARGTTPALRAVVDELNARADDGMRQRGFSREQRPPADSVRWCRPAALPLTQFTVEAPVAPIYGGLEVSLTVRLELRRDRLLDVVPPDVQEWWLVAAGQPTAPMLKQMGIQDRPEYAEQGPAWGLGADSARADFDNYVFRTLDETALPELERLCDPEALARWAGTPQVFGRFHGVIVRSSVVALVLAGRRDRAATVMQAFETGPKSRNDADHPEAWAAFRRWIDALPPELTEHLTART